ncbi:MAG: hypothetical protein U0169_24000 [Polyangiaceae bacterium]
MSERARRVPSSVLSSAGSLLVLAFVAGAWGTGLVGCAAEVVVPAAGEKGDVPALPGVAVTDSGAAPVDSGVAVSDTGVTNDAASDAETKLQGCGAADFVDRSDATASRNLTWDFDAGSIPERCMKIKVGQTVTWTGNFTTHPLVGGGGDTPNPVDGAQTAGGMATFANAGTYGYFCDNHAFMKGAILVVP